MTSGGVVGSEEEEDDNAVRELQEELSIPYPDPAYLFKFPYEDDYSRAWCYVYYYIYNQKVKA